MQRVPKNLPDLFKFYQDYVKVLYSSISADNRLPQEILFEIHAALDHLSRKWTYQENEKIVIEKAYSHLKRSCLDVFKLKYKSIKDQYDELKKIDLSILDNGKFENSMRTLFNKIKTGAEDARTLEGNKHDSFDLWAPVFADMQKFEKKFYSHPEIDWAKKKHKDKKRFLTLGNFILSTIASLIAGFIIAKLL